MTLSLTRLLQVPAVAAAVLLSGCSIPPRPQAPVLVREAPLAGIPSAAEKMWPQQGWWTRYHDDDLDAIETKALAVAPSLAVARARFDEAVRTVDVARAAGGASVDGNAQVQRERLSEHGLIPSSFLGFTWYNQGDLGVQFRYDFDFWGSHRAEIAAAIDRAHASAAERDSAANMLTAAVADSYFGWQADQARLVIARDMVAVAEQVRAIAAARVKQGVDDEDTIHQADANIASAREEAANIEWSAQIHRAAIAVLLGVVIAELPDLKPHPLPQAATALPAGAGLDLVYHRADVEASRLRVEAALRDIDVARAAFYPDISLGAMVGLSSIELSKLLNAGSRVADVGPALHLPIFEGGRLKARFGSSQAALQSAIADYNQTVVDAARDAAGQSLLLLQVQARKHEHDQQLAADERLRQSAISRAKRGLADARPELAAMIELDRQRDADTQLMATALSAEIALTKALGGGYLADAADKNSADSNNVSAGASPQ